MNLSLALFLLVVQVQDTTAFRDADARVLVARARAARDSLATTLRAYTAVVKQRAGVALRTPLKDRTLYRSELAARVFWKRDDETVVHMLGAREFHPGSEYTRQVTPNFVHMDEIFDPAMDRLYFGLTDADDDDVWIDHPLIPGAEAKYRYQTGDTITMTFADGRTVQVVELRVLPRSTAPRLISGSIWVEPESGAIVKAAYHLPSTLDPQRDTDVFDDDDDLENVPGMFKPFELAVTMISVEYSYWRLQHWLPRALRIEGTARAGIVQAPAILELAYDVQDVVSDSDTTTLPSARALVRDLRAAGDSRMFTQRRNGVRSYTVVPGDLAALSASPHLPPPVWDQAPEFITEKELRAMYGGLIRLPAPESASTNVKLYWGIQRADLLRYNRVEGLSVGARLEARRRLATYWTTGRIGVADLSPNIELGARRETLRRTLSATVSHGLTAVDTRYLGLGSSLAALVLGRDDGDYYRTSALRVGLTPPTVRPEWYRLTLFAERQRAAERETNISLPHLFDRGHDFRPNLQADALDLAGAELQLRAWRGSDPRYWQSGFELRLEGAGGSARYGSAALTARTAFPLFAGWRTALEASAGASQGTVPVQKQFFLGGAETLRGYAGAAAVGPSFLRARAELARTTSAAGIAFFSDAGWAGTRNTFDVADALLSIGVGGTILDGLVRIDLARALRRTRGWRLELHLDAII